jgi:peptidoglycan/LPS O-acetylase OafA/YrhL
MLAPLTSLRFFAAFAIVVHHVRGHFLPADILAAWPLDQGVSFFFVLSGFVLTHVHSDLTLTRTDLQNFFVARFARIWPAHVFAIVLLLTLVGTSRVDGPPPSFLLNLLLLQGWVPIKDVFFSYNGLSWTVSTELGFYVLFPLLIHRWSETWWWKLTLAAALLAGLIVICTKLKIPDFQPDYNGVTNFGLLYINPLGRLLEFVLGMTTALAWRRFRPQGRGFAFWTIAEIAVVFLSGWMIRFGTWEMFAFSAEIGYPMAQQWIAHASGCVAFAVAIFVLASGSGAIGRLLTFNGLVFLGEISYSLYMLHQVLIRGYVAHMTWAYSWPMPLKFSIFMIVLLTFSIATYLWIERPARSSIRRAFSRETSKKIAGPASQRHFSHGAPSPPLD